MGSQEEVGHAIANPTYSLKNYRAEECIAKKALHHTSPQLSLPIGHEESALYGFFYPSFDHSQPFVQDYLNQFSPLSEICSLKGNQMQVSATKKTN